MGRAFFDARNRRDRSTAAPGRAHGGTKARLRKAAMLQALAATLWIPQAGLLAISVGRIADGHGFNDILWPAFAISALGIVKSCLDAAGGRLAFQAARQELTQKREMAAAVLAACSPVDIGRPASGHAASVLGEQAELIVPYLARFQPVRMKASWVPVAILICVFPISWIAALVLLFSAPLIPIFMALIGWRAQAASEKQLVATGSLNAFLLDRLRGLATIRALDAVDATALRLRADAGSLRLRTMAVLKIAFLSSAVLELFAALGVAMIAVYIGFSLLGEIRFGAWSGGIDLTQGLFILLLAPAFFEPLRELSAIWHDRASGEAALKAIDALAKDNMRLAGEGQADEVLVERGSDLAIRLNAASFRYGLDQSAVLDGVTMEIAAGEHVALVGASGSGKSTLLALVAGLAPCGGGSVTIGGQDVACLRGEMVWIGQKPHIFAGTISSNIAFGRPSVGHPDIAGALAFAKLGSVAEAYGKRPLGEAGIGLSGGEVLRLAIARAACNPQARIILADEPTAHLDAATASEIIDALLALAKGRTLVVATHDPRLAARLHRSVRLDADLMREAAE